LKIAVPKEVAAGERRVALVPDSVQVLVKDEHEVAIEADAGREAGFEDEAYRAAGATISTDRKALLGAADLVLKVQPPGTRPDGSREVEDLRPNSALISLLRPLDAPEITEQLAKQQVSAFSVEFMPRISRAQSMDVLSSQSTIAGYRAVLLAATALPRIFPMLVTAAGTLKPARVLVIGAGVAGLQALGTAKRLGAITSSYDTRTAVREQVESVGARFVELDLETGDSEGAGGYAKAESEEFYTRQREQLAKFIGAADVVITTALVPGRPAPLLITEDAVRGMQPASVIVDLAAEKGGNCELTVPDETVIRHGVTIIGNTNLPADVPAHASQMYAKNLITFLAHLVEDGAIQFDLEDEITQGTLVAHAGEVTSSVVRDLLSAQPAETSS
jgi:NAD(P) transhydrogenase subunit alpha